MWRKVRGRMTPGQGATGAAPVARATVPQALATACASEVGENTYAKACYTENGLSGREFFSV